MRLHKVAALFSLSLTGVTAFSRSFRCNTTYFNTILPKGAYTLSAVPIASNGTYGEEWDIAYPVNATNLPPLCAVHFNVTSFNSSSFSFGLFLPNQWNQRFLTVGNGGFTGGVNWLDVGAGAQYGFATMSSDLGHNATAEQMNWAWFHANKVIDWSYRSLHSSILLSKQILNEVYGAPATYSYFSSCSEGGRQGLMEAQMYPEDFDGVVAGAPGWWTSHSSPWTLKQRVNNLPVGSPQNIPEDLFPHIQAAVMKQCDHIDGLVDGIISDPTACHVRVNDLLCVGLNVTNSTGPVRCLLQDQIDTIHKIYDDYYEDDQWVFPSLEAGSEAKWDSMYGPRPPKSLAFILSEGKANTIYDKLSYAIVKGMQHWAKQFRIDADTYDLTPFEKRGGKLLTYHGWADPLVPPRSSIYYYDQVKATMEPKGTNMSDFYRLFMIPGMQHCTGTAVDAPWYFAAGSQAWTLGDGVKSTPGFEDAQHDALLALMNWVEKQEPIDTIIATAYKNNTFDVLRQRPLCPYPSKAVYKGEGDEAKPENWQCEAGSAIEAVRPQRLFNKNGTLARFPRNMRVANQADQSDSSQAALAAFNSFAGANGSPVQFGDADIGSGLQLDVGLDWRN